MQHSLRRADSCLRLQKRLNLTKTVRKLPISQDLQRQGHYIHDDRQLDIKYDDLPAVRSAGHFPDGRSLHAPGLQ